jgi:hypothetical protein
VARLRRKRHRVFERVFDRKIVTVWRIARNARLLPLPGTPPGEIQQPICTPNGADCTARHNFGSIGQVAGTLTWDILITNALAAEKQLGAKMHGLLASPFRRFRPADPLPKPQAKSRSSSYWPPARPTAKSFHYDRSQPFGGAIRRRPSVLPVRFHRSPNRSQSGAGGGTIPPSP